jgi:hypothetical protein
MVPTFTLVDAISFGGPLGEALVAEASPAEPRAYFLAALANALSHGGHKEQTPLKMM